MSVIFKVFKKDEVNNNEIIEDTEYEFRCVKRHCTHSRK
jgi:hypothetical protein